MKRINKNIAFNLENVIKIEKYAKDNKITFTGAINEMVDNMPYDKNALKIIDKNVVHTKVIANLVYELLKQLYSDLSFSKLSNIKDSKTLNEFLRKHKIDD